MRESDFSLRNRRFWRALQETIPQSQSRGRAICDRRDRIRLRPKDSSSAGTQLARESPFYRSDKTEPLNSAKKWTSGYFLCDRVSPPTSLCRQTPCRRDAQKARVPAACHLSSMAFGVRPCRCRSGYCPWLNTYSLGPVRPCAAVGFGVGALLLAPCSFAGRLPDCARR